MDPRDDSTGPFNLRRPEKMAESLARQIVEQVVAESMGPGDKLDPEIAMSVKYHVGRATVREAIRLLEIQGLVSTRPGRGGGPILNALSYRDFAKAATFQLKLRGSTYGELLETRLAIEPMMARLVAEQQDPDTLTRVVACAEGAAELDMTDTAGFIAASNRFHETISTGSGNGVLDLLGGSLREIYRHGRIHDALPVEMEMDVVHTHQEIARAIGDGAGERAAELMRSHILDYSARSQKIAGINLDRRIEWLD